MKDLAGDRSGCDMASTPRASPGSSGSRVVAAPSERQNTFGDDHVRDLEHSATRGKRSPDGQHTCSGNSDARDRGIDWQGLRDLIDWHILAGSDAIVVMGSTGESATLSMQEHCDVVSASVRHANGRIPVIAGTGANATSEAIQLAEWARAAGAVAALSAVPYYNKPTQSGIFQHFKAISETVDIPLILYNVPGRTVTDMSNETVLRLAGIPNIRGLKDAPGDIERGVMLMRAMPAGFAVYSGDDPTAAALMLLGACGNISVTANVIPVTMSCLCAAAQSGDVATVKRISHRIAPFHPCDVRRV